MNLHRIRKESDWLAVKPRNYNKWQRLAAKTSGYITPGNIITLAGFGLVLVGIYNFSHGSYGSGTLMIFIGRLMDFFDGWVAHKTSTKSKFGEALDATIDKLEALITIPVLAVTHLVPLLPLLLVFAQGAINVCLTVYAKTKKRQLHPTKEGKLNAGAQWLGIGSLLLVIVFEPGLAHNTFNIIGYGLTIGSTLTLGLKSSKDMAEAAFNTQQTTTSQ